MHPMPWFRLVMLTLGCSSLAFAEPPEPRFEAQTLDDTVNIGYAVATGDVNGNGREDVILVEAEHVAWYRNPDWQRFVIAENLTDAHHIGLAARDITGDGQVEIAVGGQWNPAETADPDHSGAIFFLSRPDDPTNMWEPIQITPHEPTTHRLGWMQVREGEFRLIVKPLNARPDHPGAQTYAYQMPDNGDPHGTWDQQLIEDSLNSTHGMTIVPRPDGQELLLLIGEEGVRIAQLDDSNQWQGQANAPDGMDDGGGEIAAGQPVDFNGTSLPRHYATIEPMHGHTVVAYAITPDGLERTVLDDTLHEGHALAIGDFLDLGPDHEQVIAGWRNPDDDGHVGIRIYVPHDQDGDRTWHTHWLDQDGIATESVAVADLNGNGQLDIVASGRATNNLKIYWNQYASDD